MHIHLSLNPEYLSASRESKSSSSGQPCRGKQSPGRRISPQTSASRDPRRCCPHRCLQAFSQGGVFSRLFWPIYTCIYHVYIYIIPCIYVLLWFSSGRFSSGLNLIKQRAGMYFLKILPIISTFCTGFWGCTVWLDPCPSWRFQGLFAPWNGNGAIYSHQQPAPLKTHEGAFWVAQVWWWTKLDFNSHATQGAAEIPACTRIEFHRIIEDQ